MGLVEQNFRLTNEPGGLGLSCTSAGLSLAGVPLLQKTKAGFKPRPAGEIGVLISAACGKGADSGAVLPGLGVVAHALNHGEIARAMIAAVLMRLPELSWEAAARLANAEQNLTKYDPDQPRDWHGRWATGSGADLADAVAPVQGPSPSEGGATDQGAAPTRPQASPPGLAPAPVAISQDNSNEGLVQALDRLYPELESKYDDLQPVDFAKRVIEFGEWLARKGGSLSGVDREDALAEYVFLQDRVSFWLAYDYKPPNAQANLISAAFSLYEGAVNGGIVPVGGKNGGLPASMAAVGAIALQLEGAQPGIRIRAPSEGPNLEDLLIPQPDPSANLGEILDNRDVKINWRRGIEDQGLPWQRYYRNIDPDATALAPGAKGFDFLNETSGEAVSHKTLNTLSVTYARDPQRIYGQLKRYIDSAADYKPRAEIDPDPAKINSKTIQLAIPEYTSPSQWRYLYRAVLYGKKRGVSVVITRIRE